MRYNIQRTSSDIDVYLTNFAFLSIKEIGCSRKRWLSLRRAGTNSNSNSNSRREWVIVSSEQVPSIDLYLKYNTDFAFIFIRKNWLFRKRWLSIRATSRDEQRKINQVSQTESEQGRTFNILNCGGRMTFELGGSSDETVTKSNCNSNKEIYKHKCKTERRRVENW